MKKVFMVAVVIAISSALFAQTPSETESTPLVPKKFPKIVRMYATPPRKTEIICEG